MHDYSLSPWGTIVCRIAAGCGACLGAMPWVSGPRAPEETGEILAKLLLGCLVTSSCFAFVGVISRDFAAAHGVRRRILVVAGFSFAAFLFVAALLASSIDRARLHHRMAQAAEAFHRVVESPTLARQNRIASLNDPGTRLRFFIDDRSKLNVIVDAEHSGLEYRACWDPSPGSWRELSR